MHNPYRLARPFCCSSLTSHTRIVRCGPIFIRLFSLPKEWVLFLLIPFEQQDDTQAPCTTDVFTCEKTCFVRSRLPVPSCPQMAHDHPRLPPYRFCLKTAPPFEIRYNAPLFGAGSPRPTPSPPLDFSRRTSQGLSVGCRLAVQTLAQAFSCQLFFYRPHRTEPFLHPLPFLLNEFFFRRITHMTTLEGSSLIYFS